MPQQDIYQDNGTFYPVGPKSKEKFLQEHPNAKAYSSTETDLYSHGGKFYPVGPKSEDKFLKDYPDAILVKKKDQNTAGSSSTGSDSSPTVSKKVPSDITTNLAPSNVFGPFQGLANKMEDEATKGQSGKDTPYKQAQQDLELNKKYQDYMQQFKAANANPYTKPLATPKQALTPEDWNRLQKSSSMTQMQHAFLTDPTYLNQENRNKYYEGLPGMSKEDLAYLKEQGELYANKQKTYNFQRDMAVKYPTPDNLAAMGYTQMEVGDTLTAYKTFQHIKDVNPDAPQYYQGMAALSYKHGKALEAVKFMDDAIVKNPTDAGSYSLRAQYNNSIGNHKQALDDAANAIHYSQYGTKQSIDAYSVRAQLRHDAKDYTGSASDYAKAKGAADIYNKQFKMASEQITPEIQSSYAAYSKKYKEVYGEDKEIPPIETFASYYKNTPRAQTQTPTDDQVAGLTTFESTAKQNEYDVKHPSTGLTGIITHPVDYVEQHAGTVGQGLGNTFKGVEAITNDSFNPKASAGDIVNDALKTVVSGAGTAFNVDMLTTPLGIASKVAIEGAEKTKIGKEAIDEIMTATGKGVSKILTTLGTKEEIAKNIGDVANIGAQILLFHKGYELYGKSIAGFKEGYHPLYDFTPEESAPPIQPKSINEAAVATNEGFIPKAPAPTPSELHSTTAEDAIFNNSPLSTQQTIAVSDAVSTESQPTPESIKEGEWLADQKTKFYLPEAPKDRIKPTEVNIKSIDYTSGEKAPVAENATPQYIAEDSNNPAEIIDTYNAEAAKSKKKTPEMFALANKFKSLTGKTLNADIIEDYKQGGKGKTYKVTENKAGEIEFTQNGVKILKGSAAYKEAMQEYNNKLNEKETTKISQTRLGEDGNIQNDAFGDHRQALITGKKEMPNGDIYERQEPLKFIEGNWKSFNVADGLQVKAIYSLVPRDLIRGNDESNFLRFSRPQNRVIRDLYSGNKTPNIYEPSKQVLKKGDIDFSQGKFIEPVEGTTEADYNKEIAEKSTSPAEIADLYASEKTKIGESENHQPIADAIGKAGVDRVSYIKYGDVNNIGKDIAMTHFRKGGQPIDTIAQNASYAINPEGDGTDITPQDVVNYIEQGSQSKRTPLMKYLEARFQEVTGRALSDKALEEYEQYNKHKYLSNIEIRKALNNGEITREELEKFHRESERINQDESVIKNLEAQAANGEFSEEAERQLEELIQGWPRGGNLPEGITKPSLLGLSDNVHTGAPLVNDRGEVLQGYGRMNYNLDSDYYDHLKEIESETGVKIPDDAQEKGLQLVRKTKISDEEAMNIASKTTLDMHPADFNNLMAGQLENVPTDKLQSLDYIMTGRGLTLEDALEKNGMEMVKWFTDNRLMSEHDANRMMIHGTPEMPPTSLNPLGMERFKGLFRSVMSKDAHPNFKEYLNFLPDVIKQGIDLSAYKILAMGENSPLEHIQAAIGLLGDHKMFAKEGISYENHADIIDEYKQKATDHLEPEDFAFARILNGMQYPNDLPNILESIKIAMDGDKANSVPPVTLKEYFDINTPESALNNGNNLLNSLYEKSGSTERPETTKNTQEGNTGELHNGNETEPQGKENDQNVGKASASPKDIQRLVEEAIPIPNKIKAADIPILDNVHLSGIGGMIGNFVKKSDLAANYLNGMTALHFMDNLHDINTGKKTVDDNRLAAMYNKIVEKYPQCNTPEVNRAARYMVDRMINRPGEAIPTTNAEGQKMIGGKVVSPEAQVLINIHEAIYSQIPELIKKAKEVNGLPESFKENLKPYIHREALQYSAVGKEAKRQMLKALKGESMTDMAVTLTDYFADQEKSGMKVVNPDFLGNSQEYFEVTDPQGNMHIIKFDQDNNIAHLWKNGEKEFGGKPQARINEKGGNGDIPNILQSGKITMNSGGQWNIRTALQEDIEKHTPQRYVNNPIYAAIQVVKAFQDMVRSSETFNTMANAKELKPFTKVLGVKEADTIRDLMTKWKEGLLAKPDREDVLNQIKEMGDINGAKLPPDLLDNFDFAPKGSLPAQFDNTLFKKGSLDRAKTALQGIPSSASKAARFITDLTYVGMLGVVHPINTAVLASENLFSGLIDPLLYKGARSQYFPLAIKTSRNQLGPATSQMMRAGLNLMTDGFDKEEANMVKNEVEQYIAEHKDYQNLLAEEEAGKSKLQKIGGIAKTALEQERDKLAKVAHTISDWELRKPYNFMAHNMVIRELGKIINLKGVTDLDKDIDWKDPVNIKAMEQAVNNYNMRSVNYKIPSHVLLPTKAGATISKLLHNKYVTIFAGYDYSKPRTIKNDLMAVANIGIGKTEEDVLNNKKGATAALKLVFRGLLWSAIVGGLIEHYMNKDDKEKEYNKTPEFGDTKEVEKLVNMFKTGANQSVSQALIQQVPLSPVISRFVGVLDKNGYFQQHIQNPNAGSIENTYDAVKYMLMGGSIPNMLSHVKQSDHDVLMAGLGKIFGIQHSHFTPKQRQVVDDVKYYNSHYKKEFKDKNEQLENEKSDNTTQATINSWMKEMQDAEKGLINTDYASTNDIINGLKSGYYSPIAEGEGALEYWTKHLAELESLMKEKDKESPWTKADVEAKYTEVSSLAEEINQGMKRK